ncbi:MAG: PAS domain S-box protein, partial [Deltaproteobacteria bacterium]|nr:PAS domain S-box protein [Deltaproteobacteria bacterium]
YMEGLSLFSAPFFLRRRAGVGKLFAVFSLIFLVLMISIFQWRIFPACFVEGAGLTPFKKGSEYLISLILIAAGFLLARRRKAFERKVLGMLLGSILLTILSELCFTFYIDVYGLSNLVGHYFKIISFYLIYKALIETGLMKPYVLLFRKLKQRETALKESEENYRNLIQSLQEGIWVLDREGNTSYVNPRMAEMLGFKPEEMEGRPLTAFMDKVGLELFKRVQEGSGNEGVEQQDIELVRKDGGRIYTIIQASPLADSKGSINGTIAAVTEITERKRAEEKLRRELEIKAGLSELYEPLMSPSTSIEDIAGIVLKQAKRLTGSQHGYVSSIDPDTGAMTAHTLTEMLKGQCNVRPKKAGIVFGRGEDGRYPGLWGHSLNTRVPLVSNSPSRHPSSTGTPEGHIPVNRFLSVPVLLGSEVAGQIALANAVRPYTEEDLRVIQHLALYYALALQRKRAEEALKKAHDELEIRVKERTRDLAQAIEELRGQIKERLKAEKALRESEKKYSTLVEESLMGVYIQQGDRIVFANDRFAKIHGYKREEIVGMESLDLVHPDDRGMVKTFRERRTRGESAPSEYEARGLTKEGKTIWITRRINVVTYGGKPAVLGNVVDITERKRMEAALRASEKELRILSAQLLSAEENERKRIAQELHDSIGQSLGAIKFSLENTLHQLEKGEGDQCKRSLGEIVPLTQKAIEEVRRIVMDLRPSILDDLGILPTISWFCRQFQTIYAGIQVETQIGIMEQDIPDPLKTVIYRVLQEAFNNVAKHSTADRVRLSLRKNNGHIELEIEDNGAGFDVDQAISRESTRRGFGLASMKERTELSGGTFSMQSEKGRGTRIHAAWPLLEQ